MPGEPISRRRFLAVGGFAIGGAAVAGITWLARAGPVDTSASVSTTTPTTAPSLTSTQLPEATAQPSTTSPAPTTTAETSSTTAAEPEATIGGVICKAAWGANPVVGTLVPHTVQQMTVHHTAVVLSSNAEAPARARQHQSYHQSLGWSDLAYHFLIDANGHIYEGRPVGAVGDTGTDYDPTGHLLICCEGDFNSQQLTAAQYGSLIMMLAWGSAEFGIDPAAIRGHRDVASTTCPGDSLYAHIADGSVARDVAAALTEAARAPVVDVACGPAAEDYVAAIEAGDL